MELRGSKWSMRKRRSKNHPLRLLVLAVLILVMFYINKTVVPTLPKPFVPTPTPTENPEVYLTKAKEAFRKGQLTVAIQEYRQAILHQPDQPSLYTALARVQLLAGQYAAALTSAENALLLNPDYALAHALRGYALYNLGNTVEAQTELQRAVEIDPNLALAHAFLAKIYADQNLYAKADEEIRKALSLAPEMLEVRQIYGDVLFAEGHYQRAIEEYQAALAINNNIPALHLTLGLLYRALGRKDPTYYNKAIDEFLAANALNPSDPMPDAYAASTYAVQGQFGRALQYASKAVEEAPGNPYMHGNYGILLYKNGKYQQAVRELALAVRGGTTADGVLVKGLPLDYGRVADYYSVYGLALVKIGRCDEAIPVFQALLAGVPTDEVATYNAKQGLEMCSVQVETPTPTLTPEGTGTPSPTPTP